MSESAGASPSFEQIFGFREPTPQEADEAAEAMEVKFNTRGKPVGSPAFFSVPSVHEEAETYMVSMAEIYAETHGITQEAAYEMVFCGYIGCLEYLANLRLRVEE
jgi:hypothetical protein